jgi:WD40 repeat protein
VNKTIRIYRFADLVSNKHACEIWYPVLEISSRYKFSSACFNTYIQPRLAAGDFDGTVQLWDTQNSVELVSYDEHMDRVWSVDCSALDPSRILSASMDKTAKLWDAGMQRSLATIQGDSQVCFFPREWRHAVSNASGQPGDDSQSVLDAALPHFAYLV